MTAGSTGPSRHPAPTQAVGPAGAGWSPLGLGEVLFGLLDAVGARTVVEVGAGAASTPALVEWAAARDAHVVAVDPDPPGEVDALAAVSPALTLLATTGLEALAGLGRADAYLLDGDHNHYTVSAELRLLAEQAAASGARPLVVVAGTSWPWGRRDQYHRPEELPPAAVAPHDWGALVPWSARTVPAGWRGDGRFAVARHEGGPANGVLTAVEDWLAATPGWATLTLPCLGGVTLAWRRDSPWAAAVQASVGPLDGHPLLARVEAERVAAEIRAATTAAALEGAARAGADRVAALEAALDAARAELAVRAEAARDA